MEHISIQKDYNSLRIFFGVSKYLGFAPASFDIQESKIKIFKKTLFGSLWLLMFLGSQYISVNELIMYIRQFYMVTACLRSTLAISEVVLFAGFVVSYIDATGRNWKILLKKIVASESKFTMWGHNIESKLTFSKVKITLLYGVHISFIVCKHYGWYHEKKVFMMIVTLSSRFIDLFELLLTTFCILIVGWAQARYHHLNCQLQMNRKITSSEVLRLVHMYKSCGEVIEQFNFVVGGLMFGIISRNIELFLLIMMYAIDARNYGWRDSLINYVAAATYAVSIWRGYTKSIFFNCSS